jgi:hypothetical protein
MNERPTPEDISDMLIRMEQAGWRRKGFAMMRGRYEAVVGIDGSIFVRGPDEEGPKSVDEILQPVSGDGKWGHDA